MDEKALASDFLVKGSNLYDFLNGKTNLSDKLFCSISLFCESIASLKNPILSKLDISQIKKAASLEGDKITLYLNALFSLGIISPAQRESVLKSLEIIKKEINI